MSITIITLNEYKTRYPDTALSGIRDARIQSAINLSFSYLDVKTGCAISTRWNIEEGTTGYLTTEQKGFVKEAMYVETQYILSNNMDFSQGAEQTSFGSLSVSSSRPNRKEVCESALLYLQKAGLYDYLQFSSLSYAGGGYSGVTSACGAIDPTETYITETVADSRYVHKNQGVEYAGKYIKVGSNGYFELTDIPFDSLVYYTREQVNKKLEPLNQMLTKLNLGYLKSINRNTTTQTITITDSVGNYITFPYGGTGGGGGSGNVNDVTVNGVSVVDATHTAVISLTNYATLNDLANLISDGTTVANKTWSSNKIQSKLDAIAGVVSIEVVETTPSTPVNNTMYYIHDTGTVYNIKLYTNNAWTDMGNTSLDLTNYYTKSETNDLLNAKQDTLSATNKLPYAYISDTPTIPTKTSDLTNDSGFLTSHQSLADYYTKTETDTLLNAKQPTLVSGTNIKTINGSSVLGSGDLTVTGEPSSYIKNITNSNNTYTATKKDDTTIAWTIPDTSAYVTTANTNQEIDGYKTFKKSIKVTPSLFSIVGTNNDDVVSICGGTSYSDCGALLLYGSGHSDNGYKFALRSGRGNASATTSTLWGYYDGTLQWEVGGTAYDVLTSNNGVTLSTTQEISGAKTFTQPVVQKRATAQFSGVNGTTTELDLRVHTGTSNISQVQLYANGDAKLIAGDGTNRKDLVANSSGTLTWNSKYLSGLSTNVELNDLLPMEKEAGTDTTNTNRARIFQNQWSLSAGATKTLTVGRTGMIFFKRGSSAYCGFWTTWDTTLTELVNTLGSGTFSVSFTPSSNTLTVTNNTSTATASMVGMVITVN